MKYLLTCIVLLSSIQYANADMTLQFKELKSQSLTTYSIKQGQLKFIQSGEQRINLFDHKKQAFISFDPESGKKSMINQAVLDKRISQLNQRRLKKLARVENDINKKGRNFTPAEQEVADSLINLLKYPEMYGEHVLLNVKKTSTSKQINNIDCRVYQLYRAKKHLKDVCIASRKDIKMSHKDYQTLRDFYAFDYNMQTRLMLAMGNSRFSLIDYDKEKIPGIIIEDIDYKNKAITQHLILQSNSAQNLKKALFSLPVTTSKN